jgi:uncharacterized protein YndB with AHSA1/START domain
MTSIKGRASSVFDASPDVVFAKLTDIAALPSWNVAMRDVCELPERLEPGAEWVVEFHAFGKSWRSRSRCEAIDRAARRFTHRTRTDDGNPSYADWQWTVTPVGKGSGVEVSWDIHPATFWRRVLLARIRARQLQTREVPASLEALARTTSSVGSTA